MGPAALAFAAVVVLVLLLAAVAVARRRGLGLTVLGAAAAGGAASLLLLTGAGTPGGAPPDLERAEGVRGGRPPRRSEKKPAGHARRPGGGAPPLFTPAEAAAVQAARERWRAAGEPRAAPYATLAEIPESLPFRERGEAAAACSAVSHFGQRKLLLAEVEFLTLAREALRADGLAEGVLLYVGAGPGNHTAFLLDLFPEFRAVLFDRTPFVPELARHPRATIHARYFEEADAAAAAAGGLGAGAVFLISDIRSHQPGQPVRESDVRVDLARQRAWTETVRPRGALLKFRVPFDLPELEYLAGDGFLQPWAPALSAETRLVVWRPPGAEPYPLARYDRTYEGRLYFHNIGPRQSQLFANPALAAESAPLPAGAAGLDHCWDCAREAGIWRAFLESGGVEPTAGALAAHVAAATRATRQHLSSLPHARGDAHRLNPPPHCDPAAFLR